MLAYSLLIGSWFITARPEGRTRPELSQLALDRLLTDSWQPG
jgi:hypothetical protein